MVRDITESKMHGYVSKPIVGKDIELALNRWLGKVEHALIIHSVGKDV